MKRSGLTHFPYEISYERALFASFMSRDSIIRKNTLNELSAPFCKAIPERSERNKKVK